MSHGSRRIAGLLRLVQAVVLTMLSLPAPGRACLCESEPLLHAHARAVAIFSGRVVEKIPPLPDERGRLLSSSPTTVRFVVDRWWKGARSDTATTVTVLSADCDYRFTDRESYLVVAHSPSGSQHAGDGACYASRCSATDKIERAGPTIDLLNQIEGLPQGMTDAERGNNLGKRLTNRLLRHPEQLQTILRQLNLLAIWPDSLVSVLRERWDHFDAESRLEIVRAIRVRPPVSDRMADFLGMALRSPDDRVRDAALRAASEHYLSPDPHAALLETLLSAERPQTSDLARGMLARSEDKDLTMAIVRRALQSPSADVLRSGLKLIVETRADCAFTFEEIGRFCGHADPRIQEAALRTFPHLTGNPRIRDDCLRSHVAIFEHGLTETATSVAAEMLEEDPGIESILREAIDMTPELATVALRRSGDGANPNAWCRLVRHAAVSADPRTRAIAIAAHDQTLCGDRLLELAFEDPSHLVRDAAVKAAFRLRVHPEQVRTGLLNALAGSDEDRIAAGVGLLASRPEESAFALPVLRTLANEGPTELRREIQQAVQSIARAAQAPHQARVRAR